MREKDWPFFMVEFQFISEGIMGIEKSPFAKHNCCRQELPKEVSICEPKQDEK
jgi:hypothetical protein